MPKFLYSIILALAILWWFIIKTITTTPPEGAGHILTFLIVFFITLALTLSLPFYFYFYGEAQTYTNLRMVYRRAFKWGVYISVGVVFIMGMRAFKVFSILNLGLFLVLYFAIFLQIKGKR
jgi:hypothetical protein